MEWNLRFRTVFIVLLIVLVLVAIPNSSFAQSKAEKIDEYMELCRENNQFNGSVLVSFNGNIILKKGYGLADMEWDIPNEADTKFRIGSITKQFTSMLIMQLVKERKIKLDEKITTYLPEYRKDTGDRVTIHNLLTHTSGIPNYTAIPGFWSDSTRNPYTVDYVIEHFCSGDLEFEPGSKYNYSNSNYYILGAIIEKVTGKPYEYILKEKILKPVAMKNTGLDRHDIILKNRASGYQGFGEDFINAPYMYVLNAYAAGAMYSTVEDLYLWDQALYRDELISGKYKDLMFKPHIKTNGAHYGYGWGIVKKSLPDTEDSILVISHSGGINGFTTVISRLVEDRHLIVLFDNTTALRLGEIRDGIINILYDKPYSLPKKPVAMFLLKLIKEEGIDSCIKKYHEIKEEFPDDYDFSEGQLNFLGYQLLGMKKVEEAIEIFKLNIEAYPEAYNTYDSMGEAYMIAGEKELAIKNYAKSLELNPDNYNAIRMLNKILEN